MPAEEKGTRWTLEKSDMYSGSYKSAPHISSCFPSLFLSDFNGIRSVVEHVYIYLNMIAFRIWRRQVVFKNLRHHQKHKRGA